MYTVVFCNSDVTSTNYVHADASNNGNILKIKYNSSSILSKLLNLYDVHINLMSIIKLTSVGVICGWRYPRLAITPTSALIIFDITLNLIQ